MRLLDLFEQTHQSAKSLLDEFHKTVDTSGLELDLEPGISNNPEVLISWIHNVKAPKGHATQVLKKLTQLADKHQVRLVLSYDWWKEDGPVNHNIGLGKLYQRLGFEVIDDGQDQGENIGFGMERLPQSVNEVRGYHGTSEPRIFQKSHTGTNSTVFGTYHTTRTGTFFSDNPEFAKIYGDHVREFELDLDKIVAGSHDLQEMAFQFAMNAEELGIDHDIAMDARSVAFGDWSVWQLFEDELGEKFVAWLQSQGYDGAAFEEYHDEDHGEIGGTTYVAFDPIDILPVNRSDQLDMFAVNESMLPDDPDYYMEEGCGVYAVALATMMGKEADIYVITNREMDGWSDEYDFEITHVFVQGDDGQTYDVRGQRSPNDMADELRLMDWSVEGPYNPQYFLSHFMGGTDDKPLYGEVDDVREVISALQRKGVNEDVSQITPQVLTKVIIQTRREFLDRGDVKCLTDVGDGHCENFVHAVFENLEPYGYDYRWDYEILGELDTSDFWADDFYADLDAMRRYGEDISTDIDQEELAHRLGGATHVWINYKGRHYDAEAPRGVDQFLELPFFQRYLNKSQQVTESFFSDNADVLMPVVRSLMNTAARPLIYKVWKRAPNAVLALAAIKKLRDQGDPNPLVTLEQLSDLDVPGQFLKRLAWEAGLYDIPGVPGPDKKPGLLPQFVNASVMESEPVRAWHVTPSSNMPSIRKQGILPQVGTNSRELDEPEGVHVFLDYRSMEDAVANWDMPTWDEDEELTVIEMLLPPGWIEPDSAYPDTVGIVKQRIPVMTFIKIYENF